MCASEQRGKCLAEFATIEGVLCPWAEGTETHRPSFRFLVHHGMVRVDTTRPRPSCKRVRDEDVRSTFIAIFLGGGFFLCHEAIDDTFVSPSDMGRKVK